MQHGVDGARVGVQVQQGAHAPYHGGQRGVKAVAGLQQHLVAGQVELRLHQPVNTREPAASWTVSRTVRRRQGAAPSAWAHSTPANCRLAKKASRACASSGGR
jgi:hypothetical protein